MAYSLVTEWCVKGVWVDLTVHFSRTTCAWREGQNFKLLSTANLWILTYKQVCKRQTAFPWHCQKANQSIHICLNRSQRRIKPDYLMVKGLQGSGSLASRQQGWIVLQAPTAPLRWLQWAVHSPHFAAYLLPTLTAVSLPMQVPGLLSLYTKLDSNSSAWGPQDVVEGKMVLGSFWTRYCDLGRWSSPCWLSKENRWVWEPGEKSQKDIAMEEETGEQSAEDSGQQLCTALQGRRLAL